MAKPDSTRNLKIVHGEIDVSEKTTSLLFPNRDQGPWLPFERFAETITTSSTKVERHPHRSEEVLVYVLDGEVEHRDSSGHRETLGRGSLALLTAHDEISHELATVKGNRARWLSIVIRLPWHTEPPPTEIQIKGAGDPTQDAVGTVQTPVVGPLARADSFSGLQVLDLEFAKDGTGFFRLGQDHRAVVYVLAGSGTVEGAPVEPGAGVLTENLPGISIGGRSGFRVALASVPVPSERKEEGPDPVRKRVK